MDWGLTMLRLEYKGRGAVVADAGGGGGAGIGLGSIFGGLLLIRASQVFFLM